MDIKNEEREAQLKVAEVRRELRDFSKKWEKSKEPAFAHQKDVDELKEVVSKVNKIAAEFEASFNKYQKLKKLRKSEDRMNNHKINAESAIALNKIFNELNKTNGAFDEGYDYIEDRFKTIGSMNELFNMPALVENMRKFLEVADKSHS
ncbi:hypothetical protein MUB24_12800 [Lederbergia sp. NSJ-179]|uniref:hypothetical protein n=1 Tax=Lederbergia sp. NSJ-179 TaxID=2931402 RepID=UPI001FCFA1F2|nr:hypothetical protein [Lederbergia sp. NSJ-179]MCJ7841761.1 hypothetical protein [Lederbergia sp. NSJ-179]